MSKIHRLSWIDAKMRQNSYPKYERIAEHFSISARQAARDIEYLRDTMGAPIAYCYQRKGYYYTHETFVLGNLLLTDEQRQSLAYLSEQYAQLETEHARHLATLFRRLVDDCHTGQAEIALPFFPVEPAELEMFDTINQAISRQTKVEMTYADEQNTSCTVLLSPYKLYSFHQENFVVGYCEPGRQIRFFALAGLQSAKLTKTRFDLSPLLKQAEIVPELAREANIAYIRLDAETYAQTFPFRFDAVGDHLYRVEYYDPYRLLAALFASPVGASIQSPKWLRNMYTQMLEKKLKRMLEGDTLSQSPPAKIEPTKLHSELVHSL